MEKRIHTVRICLTLTCLSCPNADLVLEKKVVNYGNLPASECNYLSCNHSAVCRFGYEDRANQIDDILDHRMDELESDPRWAMRQAKTDDELRKFDILKGDFS